MNYDDRIMNTGLILNCFNTEFTEKNSYKGKFGYFTNCIEYYADLDKCQYGELTDINNHAYQLDHGNYYTFFLPEGAVKPEKKYIPFKYLNELLEQGIKVGATIKIKNKNYPEVEQLVVVSEINYNSKNKELIDITLGATGYEFGTLLESYLYKAYSEHEFSPFGVEE